MFSERLEWRGANSRCQQMGGQLLKVADVVADGQVTQHMRAHHAHLATYWLGLRKYADAHNRERWMWAADASAYADVSWWPWAPRTPATTDG